MILTPAETRALIALQRMPHHKVLRDLVTRVVRETRDIYETSSASEENRLEAVATSRVHRVLFSPVQREVKL